MFNVGDIITGTDRNKYTITNRFGTYKVLTVDEGGWGGSVLVVSHQEFKKRINKSYHVSFSNDLFRLVEPFDTQTAVLKKIAHLRNLFENRKQEYKPYGI